MLGRDGGCSADSHTALLAWVSAQPHRDVDSEAELVAGRAEARLRDLHPDAMTRYDQLRAGLSPVEAMREVAPLIVVEQQHATARELFTPMLNNTVASAADSSQALTAWSAALPLADTLPDAAAAVARLRELHPDAMSRCDSLRGTHNPAAALDEVGPLIGPTVSAVRGAPSTPARPQPGQDRRARRRRRHATPRSCARSCRPNSPTGSCTTGRGRPWLLSPPPCSRPQQAGARLSSAKSVAEVLTFRVEQHPVPAQKTAGQARRPPRTPTAADLAAASCPTPLEAARPGSRPQEQDLAVLGAALELGPRGRHRAADSPRLRRHRRRRLTLHVDERREGLNDARTHVSYAGADQASATSLLGQAEASGATATVGAPATTTAG